MDEEQTCLMRKKRCFSCKKKGYSVYNYPKKSKVAAVLEDLNKRNSNQEKE